MSSQKNILSAQVILNTASGVSPTSSEITSENIDKFSPPKENITLAKRAFRELGFEVGEFAGTSFSITAPVDTFIKKLGLKPQGKSKGSITKDNPAKKHLPVKNLPGNITDIVNDIVFPDAPDFGPGNF